MKLKELITQYATFRKSMGTDFKSAESLLNTFCRRMGADIDAGDVGADAVAGHDLSGCCHEGFSQVGGSPGHLGGPGPPSPGSYPGATLVATRARSPRRPG